MFRYQRPRSGPKRRTMWVAEVVVVLLTVLLAAPLAGQQPATLVGTVVAATGEPLGSVSVSVEGS
jgi:hypothetical protein